MSESGHMHDEKVKEIIAEHLGVSIEKVVCDSRIVDDLGADSIDMVELIMTFEEEFGIEITDEAACEIETVADAIRKVENELADQG